MDLQQRLLAAFRIECREHLDHVRMHFADIEVGALPKAEMDEVFRHAHSLKGAARATDLRPVESLAHRMETLLALIRAGQSPFDASARRMIGRLVDAVEDWMAAFDSGKDPGDAAAILKEADMFLLPGGRQEEAGGASGNTPDAPPAPAIARPPPKSAPTAPGDEPIKVRARSLDKLLRSAGALVGGGVDQSVVSKRLRRFEDVLDELDRAWRHLLTVSPDLKSRHDSDNPDRAIGRQVDRIDKNLRWLSGEIVAIRNQQHRTAWSVAQMADELRQDIRQVRLIAAESVFAGFRKMVRDLAADLGKQVDFKTQGFDVEADRQVLEALRDPVMHLLRNALAHGIEDPQARKRADKAEAGRLSLSFLVEGLYLKAVIEDDGRGLNLDRIREQGVARGLIGEEEAKDASPTELSRLIFTPGFSTAKEVDDIAGRGMGMSVVYEVAARLNGHAQWQPKQGPGTRFVLTVPLSVSSQRLLLVECEGQAYALAAEAVSQILRVKASEVSQVEGRQIIQRDGETIPLRTLGESLGLAGGINAKDGQFMAVVIRSPQGAVALAVDALREVAEAVVKDVGFQLPHGSVVAGGILRPDGSVVLVLNPYELVFQLDEDAFVPAAAQRRAEDEEKVPVILVVDDSMTTRTLEKSILEAHGFRVRVAVDGLDALIQVRAEPVDLVVSDVEMPRIDGFALLRELKHDRKLAHIPVILVTSLKRQEDIERGLDLGAAAYIVKQRFDQTELLETIRQIL